MMNRPIALGILRSITQEKMRAYSGCYVRIMQELERSTKRFRIAII